MPSQIAPNMSPVNPNIPSPIIDEENIQYREDFFIYTKEIPSLAAAASIPTSIQIDASSHFKWIKTTVYGFVVGANPQQTDATRIILPITMLVVDGASGLQLSNAAVPLSTEAGTGDLPFIVPLPRIFAARSTIDLTFANFGTSTYRFWVSFVGVKMFSQKPPQ